MIAGVALVAVQDNETARARRLPRRLPQLPVAEPAPVGEDAEFTGALLGVLRDQRWETAAALCERLRLRGVDRTVCDFLEDDLRQATETLADVEAFFQETMEALERPAAGPLTERASDASVLDRMDDLYQVLANLRRRMVQVAAGVRRSHHLPPP